LTWATGRFSSVTVEHRARELGVSQYTLRNLVRHALTMVTGFSTVPLRLASLVGFSFTLLGFGILTFGSTPFIGGAFRDFLPGLDHRHLCRGTFRAESGEYLARCMRLMEPAVLRRREVVGEQVNEPARRDD
jgi:hypothetical protein